MYKNNHYYHNRYQLLPNLWLHSENIKWKQNSVERIYWYIYYVGIAQIFVLINVIIFVAVFKIYIINNNKKKQMKLMCVSTYYIGTYIVCD